jgi:hypothetical protein
MTSARETSKRRHAYRPTLFFLRRRALGPSARATWGNRPSDPIVGIGTVVRIAQVLTFPSVNALSFGSDAVSMSISLTELVTVLVLYTVFAGSGLFWLWQRALTQRARATWAVALVLLPMPTLLALGVVRPGWRTY